MENIKHYVTRQVPVEAQKIYSLLLKGIRFIQDHFKISRSLIFKLLFAVKVLAITIILIIIFLLVPEWIQHWVVPVNKVKSDLAFAEDSVQFKKDKKNLEKSITQLDKKLERQIPASYYMVINSSENEFQLYKGKQLIRDGMCSTGSYILLQNGDEQKWMFKTPKGEFKIRSKTTSPIWKKPDWAFVEEGLPIPSANHHTRFEYGVLGDYALGLGQGYLIHGTLYKRFLGLPVTHGCVRMNDEDLELVYRSLNIGSKVFIY
ncbi:MAG: L,D-transpeptidase [Bacteroidales bacterium]|nr:L,D-transpeptidase [Bacteroidales bacterium]